MFIHMFEAICQEMPFKVDYVKTIFFNMPLMYEFYTSNHGNMYSTSLGPC